MYEYWLHRYTVTFVNQTPQHRSCQLKEMCLFYSVSSLKKSYLITSVNYWKYQIKWKWAANIFIVKFLPCSCNYMYKKDKGFWTSGSHIFKGKSKVLIGANCIIFSIVVLPTNTFAIQFLLVFFFLIKSDDLFFIVGLS